MLVSPDIQKCDASPALELWHASKETQEEQEEIIFLGSEVGEDVI
ncbi:hypothetical protein EOD39_12685 [Acipenser ruthenus]|uniref:Uncharacterized protein n=1 Tax=Acipenser ruthenus TaxID=7906 RepID=A0A662YRE4_ACIRT|nr:hypothetical protein EOD39_12685 [Acipenser ruthenus]